MEVKKVKKRIGNTEIEYIPIKERLKWFITEHKNWSIEEIVEYFPKDGIPVAASVKILVKDESNNLKTTGIGFSKDRDFLRKARDEALEMALVKLDLGLENSIVFEEVNEVIEKPVVQKEQREEKGELISKAQANLIYKLAKERNIPQEELGRLLTQYKVKTVENLSKTDASKLIDRLKAGS